MTNESLSEKLSVKQRKYNETIDPVFSKIQVRHIINLIFNPTHFLYNLNTIYVE